MCLQAHIRRDPRRRIEAERRFPRTGTSANTCAGVLTSRTSGVGYVPVGTYPNVRCGLDSRWVQRAGIGCLGGASGGSSSWLHSQLDVGLGAELLVQLLDGFHLSLEFELLADLILGLFVGDHVGRMMLEHLENHMPLP